MEEDILLSAVGQRAMIGYIALAPLIGLLFVLPIKWDPIGKDVEVAPQGIEAGTAESPPFARDGKRIRALQVALCASRKSGRRRPGGMRILGKQV